MRVLVTGSNGMIASSVLTSFDDSVELWTTSRRSSDDARHVAADLGDPRQTRALLSEVRPQAVLHLAGSTGPSLSKLVESNVVATVNLMQAVAEGTHVVVVGSAAEYGTGSDTPIDEEFPLQPVSRYGWSKLCQTESATAISHRRGLTTAIARPFNVVGPSLPRTTAFGNIRSQMVATTPGSKLLLTAGRLDIKRDLVPIDFVADVLVAITMDEDSTGVFNVCTGRGLALSEVVEAMATVRGVDMDLTVDPALAALPAADRIVGDPRKVAGAYGLTSSPTADDIARTIFGLGEEVVGHLDGGVSSVPSQPQPAQEQ